MIDSSDILLRSRRDGDMPSSVSVRIRETSSFRLPVSLEDDSSSAVDSSVVVFVNSGTLRSVSSGSSIIGCVWVDGVASGGKCVGI